MKILISFALTGNQCVNHYVCVLQAGIPRFTSFRMYGLCVHMHVYVNVCVVFYARDIMYLCSICQCVHSSVHTTYFTFKLPAPRHFDIEPVKIITAYIEAYLHTCSTRLVIIVIKELM
jgi:hypothetical protein